MNRSRQVTDSDSLTIAPIASTFMRGGTSKCWVFREDALPREPELLDALLIRLFGSPDARQIDGVGGGTSTTSKALIVDGYGLVSGCVEYRFAQVSVDRTRVEWGGNCGNCATALALYAVQQHMLPLNADANAEVTGVALLNTASGLRLDTEVATPVGEISRTHDTTVPGTVYPGVRVDLCFRAPTWSAYGATFPTGNPLDIITVDGVTTRATLVDAGAPAVFIHAGDLGLRELASNSSDVDQWLPYLVKVRAEAARMMGIANGNGDLQSVPKVGLVGAARSESHADLEARMVSMTAAHPSIGITSSVAVAIAASVAGSTVRAVMGALPRSTLSIGTAAGPVQVQLNLDADGQAVAVTCVRSARRIADAVLFVPPDWAATTAGTP